MYRGVGPLRGCGGDGLAAPVHSKAEQPKCCLALGGFLHLAGHFSQPVVQNFLCFCLLLSVTTVAIVQEEK